MSAKIFSFIILGVAFCEPGGAEVRLAAELPDSFGNRVGVALFLSPMFVHLPLDGIPVHPGGHIIVMLVSENANKLGRKRLIENLAHLFRIDIERRRYRTIIDMLSGSASNFFHIFDKPHDK